MSSFLYRDFSSQEQIDAQYNARASIGEAAGGLLQGFADRAASARARLGSVLDVRFGPTVDETLDVFPAAGAGAPVFVFLHGGYWRSLSAKQFSWVACGPCARGVTTVVVNYALCPKVTLDEIGRQARAAVAWTFRNIAAYGGDPGRIAVGGHSAGGQLTAMCLNTDWADWGLPPDPLAAALPISGVFDIAPLRHSYLQPEIQLDDGLIARNSPLFHVRRCATPLLTSWGGDESAEFARQSEAFHAAWLSCGNRGELLPQPGRHHLTAIDAFEDPQSALCAWLAARLRP
ncbi:MAG: alpha/beta hydrolase [Pseudomonadota bacterium]|nr:alpha/beta hydrolase [Pseudomonadota bacterium]